MNKLPAKQIYLLAVIIVGIIALSVYSTYALFTFESSTSDIVTIHTPKSLKISENVYEYQQITVEPNTVTTTDIDIYNTFEYDVCYSIWYKVLGDETTESKVQIFEHSEDTLTSSGVLTVSESIRVTIAIVNDNDMPIKINLGTLGAEKVNASCSLNLAADKNLISLSYKNLETLSEKLLDEIDKTTEQQSDYIIYKDETEIITYKNTDKVYISEKFNYNDEVFTLEESEEITIQELVDKKYIEDKDIYFCKQDSKCSILYKLTEIEKQETDTTETTEEEEIYYNIKLYDKLLGYSKGTNGLRKVNEKDYVFYGDNPNNYIYYNCENSADPSTCELWRIIGIFYNEETDKYNTKIIRNDSIGKYQFDSNKNESLTWNNSSLHKYLNEEYKLLNNYDIYIDKYKQSIETITSLDSEIKRQEETIDSKINLLNLSDYLYTSSCQKNKVSEYTGECLKNNWLNNIELDNEWTLTIKEQIEEIENNEIVTEENTPTEEEITEINPEETNVTEEKEIINYVYSIGTNILENNVTDSLEVRPVIYLKSRILLLEGEGTFLSPYIIK